MDPAKRKELVERLRGKIDLSHMRRLPKKQYEEKSEKLQEELKRYTEYLQQSMQQSSGMGLVQQTSDGREIFNPPMQSPPTPQLPNWTGQFMDSMMKK